MMQIINLVKSFNGQKVLDGINLEMPTGQITVVIGKSGVGKSVLLKHIIGLLKPDSGQIVVDGQDISLLRGRALREFKRRYAVLFQGGPSSIPSASLKILPFRCGKKPASRSPRSPSGSGSAWSRCP